jgi:hypothetical protein
MGRYSGGKKIDGKAPKEVRIVEKETEEVDTDAIANKVVDALAGKLGKFNIGSGSGASTYNDSFDSKDTMKALAESMTVQRGDSESNFEDLGNVKETKKDKKEIDAAIDFLKDVDDEDL